MFFPSRITLFLFTIPHIILSENELHKRSIYNIKEFFEMFELIKLLLKAYIQFIFLGHKIPKIVIK